ncbi:MAG: pyruvate ferredoxin oxidoreductase [Desulfobacterales bacterium]|nr:pyruvate ferredoxin oxidoreductase [Desulfobacterales bacterium]MBF0395679.1 pyruvate ferredoxin oxidoreductase [Desulfobacterales bacterium]
MRQVLEGSHAVSEAVRLAKVQVVSAYPITPQTHIMEAIAEFCANGKMNAKFICVESEHSAMASVIAASAAGVRTFTATSSHGLALMHELLHWASGARLPIVMAEVNRALAPGWNIWMDQTDSLSQRDTGWIQLYCEDSQEVLDTTLCAFKLAEAINLPVMVVLDAFFLSHTYEPVDVPEQNEVDKFLPPFLPRINIDMSNPCSLYQMAPPNFYMEMRYSIFRAMEETISKFLEVEEDFYKVFGRKYGILDSFQCDDAEIIIIAAGTTASTCRQVVLDLRETGEKVGLIKIKMFRPFPKKLISDALSNAKKIAVIDRNCSFGVGGIFAQEIKSALYKNKNMPTVFGYITGLGGRDVTPKMIEEIYFKTKEEHYPEKESIWFGINYELFRN